MKFFSSTTRQRIPSSEEEAAEAEREEVVELEQKRSRRVGLAFFELKILCTRIMVAAMGCFFNCFGVNKDSSPSSGSNLEDSSSCATTPAVKVGLYFHFLVDFLVKMMIMSVCLFCVWIFYLLI